MLEVNDLISEIYTHKGVIRTANSLTFEINTGETLGLVGESGSGKTQTALNLIGLSSCYPGIVSGEIKFDFKDKSISVLENLHTFITNSTKPLKKDIFGWRQSQNKYYAELWGKKIAIIFQDPQTSLNPYHTVLSQMSESIKHTKPDISKNEIKFKAIQWLERVKINDAEKIINSYPFELSGGMAQRVMIAIALASEPQFIILDEPTTGLDVTTQASIIALLKEIKKEKKITQLLITHDLGLVSHLADKIAVMYAGNILEFGPADEILERNALDKHPYTEGLLAALYRDDTLYNIENDVPDLMNLPCGCPFHPRCPYYLKSGDEFLKTHCAKIEPGFKPVFPGHLVRCWRSQNGDVK